MSKEIRDHAILKLDAACENYHVPFYLAGLIQEFDWLSDRRLNERVGQLGGKIKFDRPAGGGFSVTVILPLPADNKKEDKS